MKTINLRDFYPEIYSRDCFITVPDDVFMLFRDYNAAEEAYLRRRYRHKAHFSLDYGDDIEREAIHAAPTPQEQYERRQAVLELYDALLKLPEKQRSRIYAHFMLGLSKAAIARVEGVNEGTVRKSISRALQKLKIYLKNFSK